MARLQVTFPELDPLDVEIIAICAVGKALASLEDPEARMRVLRWANERFQLALTAPLQAPAPAPAPLSAPSAALHLAPAPDLTVDGLADLFEGSADPPPEEMAEDRGVSGDAEDLSDLYEPPSAPVPSPLRFVLREELPFDQVVADFVDTFQRLARECQSV